MSFMDSGLKASKNSKAHFLSMQAESSASSHGQSVISGQPSDMTDGSQAAENPEKGRVLLGVSWPPAARGGLQEGLRSEYGGTHL